MGCERYKDWLMDAALGRLDTAHEAELQAHVRSCAPCAELLERQRQLATAMDCVLEASAAVEPSPEFLARVRLGIAERRERARGWRTLWLPATTGAVAVVALLVFWLLPTPREVPRPAEPSVASMPPAAERSAQVPRPAETRVSEAQRFKPSATLPNAPREITPEVLVPQEGRAGVAWLYGALRRQPERTVALLAEVHARAEEQVAPLRVEELKTVPLELQPLAPLRHPENSDSEKQR